MGAGSGGVIFQSFPKRRALKKVQREGFPQGGAMYQMHDGSLIASLFTNHIESYIK